MKSLLILGIFLLSLHAWASDPKPWANSSCDFKKTDLKLQPEKLVEKYIEKDSFGQFMKSDQWFDQAVACPGHVPGWDASTVIKGYKIEKVSESTDVAIFKVLYQVLGTHEIIVDRGVEVFTFLRGEKEEVADFKVIRTPFGWKLDTVMNQHILPATALNYSVQGKSLRAQDRAVLERLAK